jgi:hypothetical protein
MSTEIWRRPRPWRTYLTNLFFWLLQSTLLTSFIDHREFNLAAVSETGASCVHDTRPLFSLRELHRPSNTSCLCRHTFCLWRKRTGCRRKAIRAVGVKHCVLSSDMGQVDNPLRPDGLQVFFDGLRNQGFSATEIDQMSKINPAKLLSLQ